MVVMFVPEPRNTDFVDEFSSKLGSILVDRRPVLALSVTDKEKDIFEATINVASPCGLSVLLKEKEIK